MPTIVKLKMFPFGSPFESRFGSSFGSFSGSLFGAPFCAMCNVGQFNQVFLVVII